MTTLLQKRRQNYSPERQRNVEFEGAYLDFTENVCGALKASGETQADLASTLGKSPPFINKVLRRNTNPSLRTLTDIAHAAGFRIRFELVPLQGSTRADQPAAAVADYTVSAYLAGFYVAGSERAQEQVSVKVLTPPPARAVRGAGGGALLPYVSPSETSGSSTPLSIAKESNRG